MKPTNKSVLLSMTGFGRGMHRAGATEAVVEVRSVNGRFSEVSVRSPRALNAYESTIQSRCKDVLVRGNITVNVNLQRDASSAAYRIDEQLAQSLGEMLHSLRNAADLTASDAPVTLDHILRFPEVLTSETADMEAEALEAWEAVQTALEEALVGIQSMRAQEGEALAADLVARIELIEKYLEDVEQRAPQRVAEAQEKLQNRLNELLSDERLNPDRLETEIAILADKLDVTEECVRLRSHLGQFRDALSENEAVGRRLNFLAQEFNREINTIASKANDADIALLAVKMKEELEKIREQVQNVV